MDNLKKWSDTWLLAFHLDKYKGLGLGNRKNEGYAYKLDQTPLKHIQSEKDPGVVIDNQLIFSEHMDEKVNKANSIMLVIRKSFKFLNCKSLIKLYKV